MVLTVQTSVSKVMSLLFNMLSRFVIAFLPRSKLSFNFMAAVTNCSDFGAQENKTVTVSTVSNCGKFQHQKLNFTKTLS